ncbi:hypothetical protein MRB53_030645 [Persea americana]|uniref:Uncharacterized protein n=1 Tax=Persea americana TaxID=3435 RepID=A0ACC2KM55_PERAE|nr:hypothetical protein MRB53_030645 [Persea americana]
MNSKRHGSYFLGSNRRLIQRSNPAFSSCCSESLPISGVDSSARQRTSSGILNVRSFYSSLVQGGLMRLNFYTCLQGNYRSINDAELLAELQLILSSGARSDCLCCQVGRRDGD